MHKYGSRTCDPGELLKIDKVEIIPTRVKYRRAFKISRGVGGTPQMTWGFPVLVKLHTDDGNIGLGEVRPSNPYASETTWSIVSAIRNFYGPALIGQNPFNIESIWARMDAILPENNQARATIDFAIHDIMGKVLDIPVYNLLGGLCNDRIPLKFPIPIADQDTIAKEISRLIDQYGVRYVKLKIGPYEKLDRDLGNLAALRDAVADEVTIQVDANAGYESSFQAVAAARQMAKYDIIMFEQPLQGWNLDGMAEVARAIDIPVLADESVFTLQDAYKVIKNAAADAINVKINKPGGLRASMKIAALAESAGLPIFVGSTAVTGVGQAAAAHFYVSIRNVWPATPLMQGVDLLEHDLLTEDTRLRIDKGYTDPPHRPGLGVELDEDAVEKYATERITVT